MIAPALPRWVAGVLADEATGVNHWAPLVPRGVSEPAPPSCEIQNAVDDAQVARRRIDDEASPDAWYLVVRIAEALSVAGDPGQDAGDTATIIIELAGVTEEQANNAVTLATAYRIMRAVRRVLNTAFVALRGAPLRLEGQLIDPPARLAVITADSEEGSGAVGLSLLLPFSLTDTWALSASET